MKQSIALRYGVVTLAVIALLALGTPARANLVTNGDFTMTTLGFPGGYVCNTLSTSCVSTVTDWSANCASGGECGNGTTPLSIMYAGSGGSAWNSVFGLSTPAADPPTGNYIGDDGDPFFRAPFFQTINGLTPGQSYVLGFYEASDQQSGFSSPTTDQWQVSLGTETQLSTAMVNSGTFFPWTPQTMTFTATSTSEVLNFLSIGPAGVPPVVLLADVSLNPAVPEPAMLIPLAGLLGLITYRVRKMRCA
jgi:hypothetical protein